MTLTTSLLAITALLSLSLGAYAKNGADIGVIVPSEVFNAPKTAPVSCLQCCLYDNKRYSEGAIIKAEGILLQCSRDKQVLSTQPLIWQRVQP